MSPMNGNSNNNNSSSAAAKTTSPTPTQWHTLAKSKDSSPDKTYSNRYFPVKVLQNLNILRQNSRFCDVSIVAGGKMMKVSHCHQFVQLNTYHLS
ncbi:hypothetical protein J6590_062411 [Homalodisca vitripennis]|nr:hypothetical protein J6590_062411 [Homalodisca vitripennis]